MNFHKVKVLFINSIISIDSIIDSTIEQKKRGKSQCFPKGLIMKTNLSVNISTLARDTTSLLLLKCKAMIRTKKVSFTG